MTYNATGKRIRTENLAGQATVTDWDCWSVTYNGENRPILWENISTDSSTHNPTTPTLISMSYDLMGRRVTKNDQRFVYNGYLQISNSELQTSNIKLQTFIWDPTEPVATHPLAWQRSALGTQRSTLFYTHDGNKNVSEVIASNTDVAAHYEYVPFGALMVSRGTSAADNPWRFSSEYAEDDTATVYYNYRHYEPVMGRWLGRDPLNENGGLNLYMMARNSCVSKSDALGLCCCGDCEVRNFAAIGPMLLGFRIHSMAGVDYGEVSVRKLLGLIGDGFIEALVETKGSEALKELKHVFKDVLSKVDVGVQVASLLISSLGHVMEVQLEIGTVYSYQRRDCEKRHWYSPRCTWSKWENIYGVKSEWKSAPKSEPNNPVENMFAVEQLVMELGKVGTILVGSINKIIEGALENMEEFVPDKVPEISDCKLVE